MTDLVTSLCLSLSLSLSYLNLHLDQPPDVTRSSLCSTSAPINTSFKQSRSLLPHKNLCGVYKTPTTVEPIISLHLTDIDLLLPKPKSCADVGILFRDGQRNCKLIRSLMKSQSKAGGKRDTTAECGFHLGPTF